MVVSTPDPSVVPRSITGPLSQGRSELRTQQLVTHFNPATHEDRVLCILAESLERRFSLIRLNETTTANRAQARAQSLGVVTRVSADPHPIPIGVASDRRAKTSGSCDPSTDRRSSAICETRQARRLARIADQLHPPGWPWWGTRRRSGWLAAHAATVRPAENDWTISGQGTAMARLRFVVLGCTAAPPSGA